MKSITTDYPFYEEYKKDEIEIHVCMLIKKKDSKIILNNDSYIVLYSNTTYKKQVMSSIFYNENSLRFIEMQNLDKILTNTYVHKMNEFKELKNKILNYDYFTQENIMLNSYILLMFL